MMTIIHEQAITVNSKRNTQNTNNGKIVPIFPLTSSFNKKQA